MMMCLILISSLFTARLRLASRPWCYLAKLEFRLVDRDEANDELRALLNQSGGFRLLTKLATVNDEISLVVDCQR